MNTDNLEVQNNSSNFKKVKLVLALIILFIIALGAGFSIYSNATSIYVDNPTDVAIKFKISDGKEYSLGSFTGMEVKIKTGNNKLIVDGNEVGSFEKNSLDLNAFLNPTQDVYVQEYLVYGDLEKGKSSLPTGKVTAYDNDLEGPFKQLEGIYISGDWDYGLNEDFPEEIVIPKSKTFVVKSKIYRFDDFVDMYNKEYYKGDDDKASNEQNGTGTVENQSKK